MELTPAQRHANLQRFLRQARHNATIDLARAIRAVDIASQQLHEAQDTLGKLPAPEDINTLSYAELSAAADSYAPDDLLSDGDDEPEVTVVTENPRRRHPGAF